MPYRKDDNSLVDDSARFGFFSGHGYVGARMDLRGSGTSTGILEDEYSAQEQHDICEVIDWISRQPWCTGDVGMTGISWSGFNSLQVAALRPPALRTIISVCSTDDRYDNDVHYLGGSLLACYQSSWGSAMHANNTHPPDPAVVGDAWRDMWLARLHHNTHYSALFTQHQRRDSYWRQGSVCEDYSAIAVPALLVGGWQDPYTDAVFRLVGALGPDSKALIGPWAHTWPDRPVPGPAIGYLQECVRWFDRWLKGVDNGVDADPRIRFYLQDSVPADAFIRSRPGRWFGSDAGPSESGAVLWPQYDGALAGAPGTGTSSHSSPLLLGRGSRHFEPMGGLGDLPDVQTRDDADALSFTTDPLVEDLAIYGQPVLRIRLASDKPNAFVFVRLTEVAPDGESYLVTRGNLNLTHRNGHDDEVSAVPVGEFLDYEVSLKHIAQTVPTGRRLRLSISTSYWPWIWPSPERATIDVDLARTSMTVPLLDPTLAVPLDRTWEPPAIAPATAGHVRVRRVVLELAGGPAPDPRAAEQHRTDHQALRLRPHHRPGDRDPLPARSRGPAQRRGGDLSPGELRPRRLARRDDPALSDDLRRHLVHREHPPDSQPRRRGDLRRGALPPNPSRSQLSRPHRGPVVRWERERV